MDNSARKRTTPRVLLAIPSSGSDGQDRLTGIFRYLSEGRFWELVLPSTHVAFTAEQLADILTGGLDGALISARYDPSLARLLTAHRVPTVILHDSWMHRTTSAANFRFVLTDHVLIGRTAARHFLSLGRFAGYGFLGDTERNRWGLARRVGFERALRAHGHTARVFTPATTPLRLLDRERFTVWLTKCPRPFALFAASDRMAVQAIGCCHACHLRVPEDVAILGVDNDESLIASCQPRLSSIAPDFPGAGYAAAASLDAMMVGRKVPRTRLFGYRALHERASTAPLAPAVKLIEDAERIIDAHATEGLTPEQVATRLHVSRKLLDLRLRQFKKSPLATAIRDRQLAEVTRLLRETDTPIRRIGVLCGFTNERSLKNIFRRVFGLSMSDYRSAHA